VLPHEPVNARRAADAFASFKGCVRAGLLAGGGSRAGLLAGEAGRAGLAAGGGGSPSRARCTSQAAAAPPPRRATTGVGPGCNTPKLHLPKMPPQKLEPKTNHNNFGNISP